MNIALFKSLEIPHDILRLSLTHHEKEKGRHENVLGSSINQDHVVIFAQIAAQLCSRNQTAASASQNDDLLALCCHRFGWREMEIPEPLLTPQPLVLPALLGEFVPKLRCRLKEKRDPSICNLLDPLQE